jgi:hypothetical protein
VTLSLLCLSIHSAVSLGQNFNYFCELGEFANGEIIESFGRPEKFELGKSRWGWPIGAIIAFFGRLRELNIFPIVHCSKVKFISYTPCHMHDRIGPLSYGHWVWLPIADLANKYDIVTGEGFPHRGCSFSSHLQGMPPLVRTTGTSLWCWRWVVSDAGRHVWWHKWHHVRCPWVELRHSII